MHYTLGQARACMHHDIYLMSLIIVGLCSFIFVTKCGTLVRTFGKVVTSECSNIVMVYTSRGEVLHEFNWRSS